IAILSTPVSFRRDSCSLAIELPPGAQVQDRTDCVRRIFYWAGPEIFSAYPVEIPALHAIDYIVYNARYPLGNKYLIPRSVFYLHRMRLLSGGGHDGAYFFEAFRYQDDNDDRHDGDRGHRRGRGRDRF